MAGIIEAVKKKLKGVNTAITGKASKTTPGDGGKNLHAGSMAKSMAQRNKQLKKKMDEAFTK